MDEIVVRGLIIGAVFMAIAITARLIWRLIRSPSEAARRARWVLGLLIALPIGALLVHDFGIGGVLVPAVVIAAGIWIYKGSKARPKN